LNEVKVKFVIGLGKFVKSLKGQCFKGITFLNGRQNKVVFKLEFFSLGQRGYYVW
jgi:hypothetical protein